MTNENDTLREMLSAFIERQTEFIEYQRGVNVANQARLNGIQDEITEFKDQANAKFAEADARFKGLANDAAEVKGGHAYIMTIQRPAIVAERLGFYFDRVLTSGELVDLVREVPGVITSDNERESFLNADLVLKVKDKADILTNYIAMEISYTGQDRDSRRAIRNAGFLSQFTGRPAYAAIASVKNDATTQAQIENKALLWYEIRAADLQPS